MIKTEWKMYLLNIEGTGSSWGSVDKYHGDPFAYARHIASGQIGFGVEAQTKCHLVETWQHKVGRSWRQDESIVGTWTFQELTV